MMNTSSGLAEEFQARDVRRTSYAITDVDTKQALYDSVSNFESNSVGKNQSNTIFEGKFSEIDDDEESCKVETLTIIETIWLKSNIKWIWGRNL